MSETLEEANQVFHERYGEQRDELASNLPLLILLAPDVILSVDGTQRAHSFARDAFDLARSAAHIAVALFVSDSPRLSDSINRALKKLRGAEGELAQQTFVLLELCAEFVRHERSATRRADLARACGPEILKLTELATAEQLSALHQAVERALSELSPRQREQLHVVVAGDHQARRRSLGMQYFALRLDEDRLIYGENIASVEEALKLVGTQRLDREIAQAFFGDAKRLQEDILGAATEKCLQSFAVTRIAHDAQPQPRP